MSVVTVNKKIYEVEPLNQWDQNQALEIRGLSLARVPEIHFSTSAMSRAIVRNATMDTAGVVRVEIPNSLLQNPYTLNVYVCIRTGATFETLYKMEVPVTARPQPEGYILTNDQEVYSFEALENEVKNVTLALTRTAEQLTEKVDSEIDGIRNVGKANSVLISGADGRLTNAGTPTVDPSFLLGRPGAAPTWSTFGAVAHMFGNTTIETGSYTGTGTFGVDSPNRLAFNDKVVAIIILSQGKDLGGLTPIAEPAFFVRGCPTVSTRYGYDGEVNSKGKASLIDWSSPTNVSWYATESDTYQMNKEGNTYYYVALTVKE